MLVKGIGFHATDMFLTFLATLLVVNCVSKKAETDTSYDATGGHSSAVLTHPRITDICFGHSQGTEGAGIKDFQLKKVFIATTSGLRTPDFHEKHSSDSDEHSRSCIFNDHTKITMPKQVESYLEALSIKEKLPGKAIKSGFKIFYSQSKAERCKSQSLSPFGVSQLINLGKYLLRSYFGKLKSLDSTVLYPGFAVCSGDESSFHDLHTLLFGLLTEKQFVRAHIDKSGSDFAQSKQPAHEYQDLHYFVEQAFIKENHLFKDTKAFTFESSNLINSIFGPGVSAKDIISHLSTNACSKFLDSSLKTASMTYEDVSNIFNTSDSYNKYFTNSPTFRSYAVARSFSLRQMVKDWFSPPLRSKHKTATNKDLKIVTFDELFMMSLLTSINVPVSQHIPPSSRLVFESFKPLFTVPVFHTVSLQPSHLYEARNLSSTLQFLSDSNEEIKLEKRDLDDTLLVLNQERSGSMESIVQPSSLSSVMTSHKVYSEKRNNDLKITTIKSPLFYIRVLYNGQVVTSSLPGCLSDPMIGLGLCSVETVELVLGLTDWKQYPLRDEL